MDIETRTLRCVLTTEERDAKADEAGRRLRDLESAQLSLTSAQES